MLYRETAEDIANNLIPELEKRLKDSELNLKGIQLEYTPNTGICFYGRLSNARTNEHCPGFITLFYDSASGGGMAMPIIEFMIFPEGVMPYVNAKELQDMKKILPHIEDAFKTLNRVKCRIDYSGTLAELLA